MLWEQLGLGEEEAGVRPGPPPSRRGSEEDRRREQKP